LLMQCTLVDARHPAKAFISVDYSLPTVRTVCGIIDIVGQ